MAQVEVYTKAFCPYCTRAKMLLESKGADFQEIDVTMDRAGFDAMVGRANGRRTVPQIFIGGKHVGGSDDLAALEAKGELDALLGAA
ncbi:MAG: glutaredoxin 3 [Sphingopyxis sp.]|uniref:glutaredoxin 3 n=1 Tax=Sphingopyxis sp. TaxID=1908224 RepID=UPI001A1F53D4|nr:glutaredoxin 3 [Sphingopyxis sp.]MBJ7500298.1 glutaredoxin 3 [Sphingopyxis sp.]